MPQVFPFRAIKYQTGSDLSAFVAPPYDVLDAAARQRLLTPPAGDPRNIVAIDLPHTPPKELGPASAYENAAAALKQLLADGTLARSDRPVIFAYRQTFKSDDGATTIRRSGMACCLETVPFGPRPGSGGVLPHEETFSGPKEDRLALMKATATQLSPIFGLHKDQSGRATALVQAVSRSRRPDRTATTATTADGTFHEVWTISDDATIAAYQDALRGEDVFIADGHHRYTTALNYVKHLEETGPVPADHPARRCMFVLIGMSDPGLIIWPTHRVLGGMQDYSLDTFRAAVKDLMLLTPVPGTLDSLPREMISVTIPPPPMPRNVLGFHDFATGKSFIGTFTKPNPLALALPDKPRAWLELDVALIQHLIVEQVCKPKLNRDQPISWAFPHTLTEVRDIGRGAATGAGGGGRDSAQLAIIVRPTPLEAVRAVSAAGHLMPQKSTFFYPKLATGLFMHGLS